MKKKNLTIIQLVALAALTAATGCTDLKFGDRFLEKAPGVDMTIDSIFSRKLYADRALTSAYATMRSCLTLGSDEDFPNESNGDYGYKPAADKLGWDNLDALTDIVNSQAHVWNVIPQFFGFITFAIAGVAVCHRHPFDQPEAEQELADGYHIEYSGMKFGLFFVGEYIGIVTISALMVTLFFGGWQGPLLPPFIWFALKTAFFMMMFILIRASLPRPRYDQVMSFGWKICLPLTLINLLVTAAVILWQAQ